MYLLVIRKKTHNVSTHASAREATRGHAAPPGRERGFNPRLRAGGDLRPTWRSSVRSSFNPRLRAGGDLLRATRNARSTMFQPTPPRGRRLGALVLEWEVPQVSTHASAREATCLPQPLQVVILVFQPTPPRGRRLTSSNIFLRSSAVSTHASAREATR